MIFNVGSGGSSGESEVKGYSWKKYSVPEGTYDISESQSTQGINNIFGAIANDTARVYIYYTSDVTVNWFDGTFSPKGTISVSSYAINASSSWTVLRNKFIWRNNDPNQKVKEVWKVDSGSTFSFAYSSTGSNYYITASSAKKYSNVVSDVSFIEYVYDMDSNAYPNNNYGEDGYYYCNKICLLRDKMDLDNYELLATHIGTTIMQYTVPDLSQYKYFYIMPCNGSEYSVPYFIPASYFRVTDRRVMCPMYGNSISPQVYYINDTTIKLYTSLANGCVRFYGMKE